MELAESACAARTVTFVVHGVGAHKSDSAEVDGATRDFAVTWGRRNRVPLTRTDHVAHPDLGPSTPYTIFHGLLPGDREHQIVELQWADLSRGRGGLLAPVVAFLRVLFGLRHVAMATELPREGPLLVAATWLTRTIFGLLRGPILAWNALMAAGLLFVSTWAPNPLSRSSAMLVVGALGCLPSLLPKLRKQWVVRWGLVGGVVAASVPWWPKSWLFTLKGLDPLPQGSPSFITYFFTFSSLVNLCWMMVALSAVVLIFAWLLGRWRLDAVARRSFDARVFLAALAMRIWSFGIPLLWSFVLRMSKEGLARSAGSAAILQVDQVKQSETAFIPLIGVNWLLFFVIGGTALMSYLVFDARTHGESSSRTPEPRLLISAGLIWVVILTTLTISVLMLDKFVSALGEFSLSSGPHVVVNPPQSALLTRLYDSGWLLSAALAATAFGFREKLKAGFDFALDVTNYFRGDGPRSMRRLVESRFAAIVGDVMKSCAEQDVVFVSHSQGTVLMAEHLRSQKLPSAWLVTMGSPISHVYQHYFRTFWPEGPPLVGRDVGGWINLFRSGDFIGRSVLPASENWLVGPGGHIGYFKDPQVHDLLEERGLLPSSVVLPRLSIAYGAPRRAPCVE
jgi:hypothetical protein